MWSDEGYKNKKKMHRHMNILDELVVIKGLELLNGSLAVAHPLIVGVGGNANNACSRQLSKVVILVLRTENKKKKSGLIGEDSRRFGAWASMRGIHAHAHTCWHIVHGIRSPACLMPCRSVARTVFAEISPSSATCNHEPNRKQPW